MAVSDGITKQCSKCKSVQPVANFGNQKARKDGLNPWCRSCKRIASKAHVPKDIERHKAIKKAYKEANKERMKPYYAAYYQANKEMYNAASAEWAKRHPEKRLEWAMADYYRNRDKRLAKNKEWRKKNKSGQQEYRSLYRQKKPELLAALSRNYKARKRNASGTHNGNDIKKLLIAQRHLCVYCKKKVMVDYHVDHVVALSKGGSNSVENLQILCPTCNIKKGNKDPAEFAKQFGMLF